MERENINMNDKPEIEIKIFGGTNMIAPAGATAVQNFYGDQFAEVAIRPEETEGIESLNDAECLLFTYVPTRGSLSMMLTTPARSWAVAHSPRSRVYSCTFFTSGT